MVLKVVFWVLATLVVYTYIGYGILITVLAKFFAKPVHSGHHTPTVTMLIAAFNEEDVIAAKIENALGLDYPAHKLEVVVVTDGSTDRTPDIVRSYAESGVACHHDSPRRGKVAALRRVLPLTTGEIVVFSDANAFFDASALRFVTAPFSDPQVGCVAGEKHVSAGAAHEGQASGEGIYWRYESFLKTKDSAFHSVVGAAGELFAVSRNLLELPPDNSLLDDFMISMLIAAKGYRVVYEPRAVAHEVEPPSIQDEFGRRARISCGGFQSIWWLRDLLHPRYGRLWLQYVSHRVLRWAAAPLALPLLLAVNMALIAKPFYRLLLAGQVIFYLVASAGLAAASRGVRTKILFVPGYFLLLNVTALVGLYRFITRTQPVTWKKAARNAPDNVALLVDYMAPTSENDIRIVRLRRS